MKFHRDDNRIPVTGVTDTITGVATEASGLAAGSVEAQAVAIVDGLGTQITSFGSSSITSFPATTKVRTSIHSATTLTAGAGNTTSSTINLTTGFGAQLSIQLTNGATGPTIAAQVQIQTANDSSGTLWVNFGGALVGSTTNSAVTSWSIDLPIGVGAVRLVSGSNTAQNVTLDADISNVTAL